MPITTSPTMDEPSLKIMEKKSYSHLSVMKEEVTKLLITDTNGLYLDATVGLGGHTFDILNSLSPLGKVLGLDMDPDALKIAQERLSQFQDRFIAVHANFKTLGNILRDREFFPLSGALFDLGISSLQLDNPEKGFSFSHSGPLDMRFSPNNPLTAAQIINKWPEEQIASLLSEFGEEPDAKRIAQAIARRREKKTFETTADLAALIASTVPRGKTHSATRSFMALRIAVNGELDNIEPGIESAVSLLKKGGRLLVITFHSLEDRIVKRLFDSLEARGLCRFLEEKSIKPTPQEIELNPRARSARLRVMEKINEK